MNKIDFVSPTQPYTAYYCEENLWWWCDGLTSKQRQSAWVLVVSNPKRKAALALQRLGIGDAGVLIWDYHVVGLYEASGATSYIVDFDTNMPGPAIEASWWLSVQSQLCDHVEMENQARIRPIAAEYYHREFSSTRRHMQSSDGSFIHPPPEWATITKPASRLNELSGLLDAEAQEGWHPVSGLLEHLKVEPSS